MQLPQKKWLMYVIKALVVVIFFAAIIVAVVLSTRNDKVESGAIATNGIECAAIGKAIAKAGGSVGDVAVATIICEGITCPQSRFG